MTGGRSAITWGELLAAVDGDRAAWRTQLDARYVAALREELFTPITATLRAWNQGRREQRTLKPVLYGITHGPADPATGARGRPTDLIVLFDSYRAPSKGCPEFELVRINARFQVEVVDEFTGTVHARVRQGLHVLDDIREALAAVYDDAATTGAFETAELRHVYGDDYSQRGIDVLGQRWESTLGELDEAMTAGDIDAVETHLASMGELNRTFSTLATERYLQTVARAR